MLKNQGPSRKCSISKHEQYIWKFDEEDSTNLVNYFMNVLKFGVRLFQKVKVQLSLQAMLQSFQLSSAENRCIKYHA